MKSETQKAWAKAVNDPSNWSYKDPFYGNKIPGELTSIHYLVYNLMRELPLERGFTRNKYFEQLVRRVATIVERINNGTGANKEFAIKWARSNYLNHFGGFVTVDEFAEKANEALRLYSNS